MRTPLVLLTTLLSLSFFDGVFGWGLPDGFYALIGFAMVGTLIWMWVIDLKN